MSADLLQAISEKCNDLLDLIVPPFIVFAIAFTCGAMLVFAAFCIGSLLR